MNLGLLPGEDAEGVDDGGEEELGGAPGPVPVRGREGVGLRRRHGLAEGRLGRRLGGQVAQERPESAPSEVPAPEVAEVDAAESEVGFDGLAVLV